MKPSVAYERAWDIVHESLIAEKPIYASDATRSALGDVIEISEHEFILRPVVDTRPDLRFSFDDVEVKYPSQSEALTATGAARHQPLGRRR